MINGRGYEDEEWRDIVGFPKYIISNFGRVWSMKRQIFLKPFDDKDGYQIVSLVQNGKRNDMKIHRLVAMAFEPFRFDAREVNHNDGDKRYNFIENLEWNTHDENMQHAFRNGLALKRRVRIIETGETFESQRSLAEFINGNEAAISECLSGKRNRHRGLTFEYI